MDLKKQLQKLDVSKLKTVGGDTVEKELKRHARFLANCIMYRLDQVYDSYTPKIYNRTYDLCNSVYVDDKVFAEVFSTGASLSIKVCFDDGAWHRGLNGKKVNTAVLLNEGWQTHGAFANVPYFGYREPTHFIELAVEDYKRGVPKPFDVKINKDY